MIPYIMVFFTLITCLIDIVLIWRNSVLELKDKQYFSRMSRIVFFLFFSKDTLLITRKKQFFIFLCLFITIMKISHIPPKRRLAGSSCKCGVNVSI